MKSVYNKKIVWIIVADIVKQVKPPKIQLSLILYALYKIAEIIFKQLALKMFYDVNSFVSTQFSKNFMKQLLRLLL